MFKLVLFLSQLGIFSFISHITLNNITFLKCFISYYKTTIFFKQLKRVSKPTQKVQLTYHALKKLNFQLANTICILQTSQGLLNHKDALRLKKGGLLL